MGASFQQTFVIIKPDAIKRGLVGEIIKRLEQKRLFIEHIETRCKTSAWCGAHYRQFDQSNLAEREIFNRVQEAMIYTQLIGIKITGDMAVTVVRNMIGDTVSTDAAPGTIRGDFGGLPIHENLVHASDSESAAVREISLFFDTLTDWD